MILARWTYSREEWKSFLCRHQKRGNLFHMILCRARPVPQKPEVVFTPERISIGDRNLELDSTEKIREINLYQEGPVNVMRLVMENTEIRIPIPRGRIREALELRKIFSETGRN